nr:WW domain-binding protein 2 isoform X3 [Pelodiscus sinensis]|eukprot:XP_025043983.1 WW domain-binding protein 2 isoform X3 [Pelodiscus sinensis]
MKRTVPASKAEQSHSFLSPPSNRNCPRVLAHFSNVQLVLDEMPNFPEELQGAKKGILYLTQYKMIFQHKDKGSTTIRFPLQLLGDCVIGEELNSRQQYIKGTSTSSQGVLTFKFIFLYGATDCLNMIQTLSSEDILREAANLQDYPTASIYTYAHPSAPRASQRQEGCCRCRALRTQEQTDRQN